MLSRIIGAVSKVLVILFLLMGGALAALFGAGVRPFIVLSGSMEPAIWTGEAAFINTRDRAVEEGDIITFLAGREKYVTHRAVRITGEGIITKGDANETEDPRPVRREDVVGTYLFGIPHLGRLLDMACDEKVRKAWLFAALLLFAATFVTPGERLS